MQYFFFWTHVPKKMQYDYIFVCVKKWTILFEGCQHLMKWRPIEKKSHSYNLSQRKRALISVIFLWSVHKWSTYIFQVNHLDHDVHIGNTGKDEMCNFYMMYWVKGKEPLGTLHFHFSILSFIIENPCVKVQNAIFFSF